MKVLKPMTVTVNLVSADVDMQYVPEGVTADNHADHFTDALGEFLTEWGIVTGDAVLTVTGE